MRTSLIVLFSLFSLQFSLGQEPPAYAIVIHGGAGNISPQFISSERADTLSAKLSEVLEKGLCHRQWRKRG